MMRDFFDFFAPFFVFVIFAIALLFSVILFCLSRECQTASEIYDTETKFYVFGGCFVKTNNEYIPLTNYENIYKNGHNFIVKTTNF